jgi:5-methylcytosine-specific restriction enzyme subunit McrC
MTSIPVRNIFYLLSYAWDLLEEAEALEVETEDLPQGIDLVARLLVRGTQHLLRRGMDRGYLPQTEVLSTIRGRIDFGASVRRLYLAQLKAQCDFEEFLPDLLHNRILKSTLGILVGTDGLAARQRADLAAVLRRMEGISPIQIRNSHFFDVHLHRNNAHYRLLMHLCELVHDNLLVNEQTGQKIFRDFIRDEKQMARLFETFIANFYRRETSWEATPQKRIDWNTTTPSDLLPEMRADVCLRKPGRVLVVECKYYSEALQSSPWSEKLRLRSQHLYQLTSYLENLRPTVPGCDDLEGLLIYPTVKARLEEDLVLNGKRIHVRTIDLDTPWEEISDRLVRIVG